MPNSLFFVGDVRRDDEFNLTLVYFTVSLLSDAFLVCMLLHLLLLSLLVIIFTFLFFLSLYFLFISVVKSFLDLVVNLEQLLHVCVLVILLVETNPFS